MKQSSFYIQVAFLIAACAAGAYVSLNFDNGISAFLPETSVVASTFNAKPSGYSGLFDLACRIGLKCRRWQHPYRRLNEARGVLVIVGPDVSPADFEIEQMLSWVKAGNRLIYLDDFTYSLSRHILSRLGARAYKGTHIVDKKISVDARGEFQHVPFLTASADMRLSGGTALLSDECGALLSVLPYGKGEVLLGVVPALAANRYFNFKADGCRGNFQFLANWLATGNGDVFFDEFCHGYSQATNVFVYLARGPAGLLALQGIILMSVAVASAGFRFGAIIEPGNVRKIATSEFIAGLANTYARVHAADLAFDVIYHDLTTRLCKVLGVSPRESNDSLARHWANAAGGNYYDMETFLSSAALALNKGHMTDEELVALVAACDKISDTALSLTRTPVLMP